MPTILSLMGMSYPQEVEGSNLSRSILGIDETEEPEFAFLQNTGACAIWENGHEWRAVRDKRYTYAIFKANDREELYDREVDPYCLNNLVQSPKHKVIKDDLKKKLQCKMHEINDTFEDSTWYRDNWIEDRCIVKTATMPYTKQNDIK
jgi:arylsulfatase A-like enzyme